MKRKTWRLIIICVALALALATVLVFALRMDDEVVPEQYKMELQLQGEPAITLEYGTAFEDPGATAKLIKQSDNTSTPVEVTVTGAVDAAVLGEYTISYTATQGEYTATAQRVVTVVDTQAPAIELVSDPNHSTQPGETYQEEGFTATDNYDGDITDKVTCEENNGIVTYTVTDSSGNTTTVTREIRYRDTQSPTISLAGDRLVILDPDEAYVEPGYSANDNCDGDLTTSVTVSGTVTNGKAGKYTITYTVKDSSDNTASATRTVFVKETKGGSINNPATGTKFIYLTFDDGPGSYTGRLLDILAKYNVPATFFVVNTGMISLIERAAAEGHTVAIHTATHNFSQIYKDEEAYFDDLYKMQSIIERYTGNRTNLLRFPGGSSNTVSSGNKGLMTRLTKMVEDLGFVYFDWNVDSRDAGGANTARQVFNNVTSGVSGRTHSVVLMHDIKKYTVDAIEDIIIWGLENGYTFLPLTEDSPTCHHRVNN